MVPLRTHFLGAAVVLSGLIAAGCRSEPLLAPSGSTIAITASVASVPVNRSVPISVLVREPAGTAPHSGTRITFMTTLGAIEPASAETDGGGRIQVAFLSGPTAGTATISATSGFASTGTTGALTITVTNQ